MRLARAYIMPLKNTIGSYTSTGSSTTPINLLFFCSFSILDLQSWFRMILAKRKYQRLLDKRTKSAILIQSHIRKFLRKKMIEKIKQENAAIILQKTGGHIVPGKNSPSAKMVS